MSIYYVGSQLADFDTLTDAPTNETGANAADYVQGGIDLNDNDAVSVVFDDFAVSETSGEVWFTLLRGQGGAGSTAEIHLYDSDYDDSNPVIRITGTDDFQAPIVRLWNGSSHDILATGSDAGNTVVRFDFQIIRDNTGGVVRIYQDGVLDVEATAQDTNLAAWSNLNRLQIQAGSSSGGDGFRVSQIILADEDTRDMILVQEDWTGDGSNTDWNGGQSEVDDTGTGLDEGTFAFSNATGQKLSMAGTLDAVIDSGYDIVASVISARATRAGTAVTQLKGHNVISSTDYATTGKTVPLGGVSVIQFIEDTSPATASAWTTAELEAAEGGVESA